MDAMRKDEAQQEGSRTLEGDHERHRDECSEGETVSPQQTVSKRERHSQTDLSSNQLEMSNLSTVLLHFIYKRTRAFSSRDGSSFPRGKELP